MIREALPMVWVEAAQAVVIVALGPRSPKLMAIWPAGMLGITMGAKKGEMRPPL